jgi:hypothetical protein
MLVRFKKSCADNCAAFCALAAGVIGAARCSPGPHHRGRPVLTGAAPSGPPGAHRGSTIGAARCSPGPHHRGRPVLTGAASSGPPGAHRGRHHRAARCSPGPHHRGRPVLTGAATTGPPPPGRHHRAQKSPATHTGQPGRGPAEGPARGQGLPAQDSFAIRQGRPEPITGGRAGGGR